MDRYPELIEESPTEYLRFRKFKYSHKKTFNIDVDNKEAMTLGIIKWHNHWRKYVFEPFSSTIFDSSCLKDITKYIDELMEDRKNDKKDKT